MARLTVGVVDIDRCPGCGGLWLDALEKDRLLEHPRVAREADKGTRACAVEMGQKTRLTCPRDHSSMIHMVDPQQPHVGFESCTVCGGVFLDAGELTDLSEVTVLEWLRMFLR